MENRLAAFCNKKQHFNRNILHIGFRGKGELQQQYMNFRKVSNSIS